MKRFLAGLFMALTCVVSMAQTDSEQDELVSKWRFTFSMDTNVLRGVYNGMPQFKDRSNQVVYRFELDRMITRHMGVYGAVVLGTNGKEEWDSYLPPYLEKGASTTIHFTNSDKGFQFGAFGFLRVGRFAIMPMLGIGWTARSGSNELSTYSISDESTDMTYYYLKQEGPTWRLKLVPGCRVNYRCSQLLDIHVGVEYPVPLTGSSKVSLSVLDAYTGVPIMPVYQFKKRTPLMLSLGFSFKWGH